MSGAVFTLIVSQTFEGVFRLAAGNKCSGAIIVHLKITPCLLLNLSNEESGRLMWEYNSRKHNVSKLKMLTYKIHVSNLICRLPLSLFTHIPI